MNTVEIPVENLHRLTDEVLYLRYYKSNLAQVRGIERKNRQLKVLKSRLQDYERLRAYVRSVYQVPISEEAMPYFIERCVKLHVMEQNSKVAK